MIAKFIFMLAACLSSGLYPADHNLAEKNLVQKSEEFKLLRISGERIAGHVLKMQKAIRRAKRGRAAAYAGLGAAVLGLCAYAYYNNAPADSNSKDVVLSQYKDKDIQDALHKHTIEKLIRKQKDRTFFGGVKRSVSNGLEVALYTVVAGAVVGAITKSFDVTSDTFSTYFTFDDKAIFKSLFNHVNSDVTKLSESIFRLAYSNDASRSVAWFFASDVMVDFSAFIYSLECVIALMLVIRPGDKQLQSHIDALERSVSHGAQNIENVLQKSDYDLELLVGACRRMQILVTKFLCGCSESLYGYDFFQT
jgi:hypothetical protein